MCVIICDWKSNNLFFTKKITKATLQLMTDRYFISVAHWLMESEKLTSPFWCTHTACWLPKLSFVWLCCNLLCSTTYSWDCCMVHAHGWKQMYTLFQFMLSILQLADLAQQGMCSLLVWYLDIPSVCLGPGSGIMFNWCICVASSCYKKWLGWSKHILPFLVTYNAIFL